MILIMAWKTASALNALLHGVCSTDFNPGDQEGLQDVLLDYFTDSVHVTTNSGSSDEDSDSETSAIEHENRYYSTYIVAV